MATSAEAPNPGPRETILQKLPPVDDEWECRHPNHMSHDVFLSYRVASDQGFVESLAFALGAEGHSVFFDKHCLNNGEDWEVGFLNGLRTSKVVVPIMSNDAVEGIKKAHERPDNMLLEYEVALELHKAKKAAIIPVLLGKYIKVSAESSQMALLPFDAFNVTAFSEEKHVHKDSCTESVRSIMKSMFKLQGISADPRDITALVGKLSAETSKAKRRYGDEEDGEEEDESSEEEEDEYDENEEMHQHSEHEHGLQLSVLQKSETWRMGWFCDVCGRDCSRKKLRYRCSEDCDWDCCEDCMLAEEDGGEDDDRYARGGEDEEEEEEEEEEDEVPVNSPGGSPSRKLNSSLSSTSSLALSQRPGVWLEKVGQGMGLLTGRKRRFFVIEANQICYYTNEDKGVPRDKKGAIRLCPYTVAEVHGKRILIKTPERGEVEARTWDLLAKSPKLAAQWGTLVWDAISALPEA